MKISKNILGLKYKSANSFLLRPESYFSGELPLYFNFKNMLKSIKVNLDKQTQKLSLKNTKKMDNVNYLLYTNKDGKYAWRNLQLINPVLYVNLVNTITKEKNWIEIQERFKKLKCPHITCFSIPVISSKNKRKVQAGQILEWWEQFEQESIVELLSFDFVHTADISECYPSIYTHSISWALHDTKVAKLNVGDMTYLGNTIDSAISSMQYGQTNGIPQGSILMDLLAELVLAYADNLLSHKLKTLNYKILRYRDDYRIFTKTQFDGEIILKELSNVLLSLNLKLNSQKALASNDILQSAIKKDKMHKICFGINNPNDKVDYQLLQVYNYTLLYPNSSQVKKSLIKINEMLLHSKYDPNFDVILSIIIQIAYKNPKLYPQACQIISTIFEKFTIDQCKELIEKILKKFTRIPHHCIMELWLQRITIGNSIIGTYEEKLCKIVEPPKGQNNNQMELWNFDWLKNDDNQLYNEVMKNKFIDEKIITNLSKKIENSEIDIFEQYRY